MPTLHYITEETKTIFTWIAIAIATLILLMGIFRFGNAMKEYFFPTPLPPPSVAFGKLAPLAFPKNVADNHLLYVFDTASGTFPNFPDRATIYRLEKPVPNFLDLKRVQDRVSRIGFPTNGIALSDTAYLWSEVKPPFRKLTFDIVSSNFTLSSNYLFNQDILQNKNLPNETTATDVASSFLSKIALLPNDIDPTKTKTMLLRVENGKLAKATSKSTATLIRVDFFQKDINNLPLYYPDPLHSTMSLFLTGGEFEPQVIEAGVFHKTADTSSSTYPIKTANSAYTQLQKGEGYIAAYFGTGNTVRIKNIFLAYYLGDTTQDYLMPIIVFTGDNGFVAYIPAVTDAWMSK